TQELPLGQHRLVRGGMIDLPGEVACRCIVRTALQAEGALADRRQLPWRNENLGDDLRKSQALEASLGKDQGVVTFFTQLAQTGFDIATNVYDTQVRPPVQHLRAAAQAAGGHGGAGSEAVEIGIAVGDEDV